MKSLHPSNPSGIAIALVVASILAVLMHQTCLWLQAIIGWLRVRMNFDNAFELIDNR
jgi:hypothetical protein